MSAGRQTMQGDWKPKEPREPAIGITLGYSGILHGESAYLPEELWIITGISIINSVVIKPM
ncbi:hypothetical protein J19TS2_51820 [Cohnella xylanilytica]|nr:hypothetical protein J19TS2_51820 [Cohnella xylanilytica]